MRQRVEDLGRISVFLEELKNHRAFNDQTFIGQPAHSAAWFMKQPKEEQEALIVDLITDLLDIEHRIDQIYEISIAQDPINGNEDHEERI